MGICQRRRGTLRPSSSRSSTSPDVHATKIRTRRREPGHDAILGLFEAEDAQRVGDCGTSPRHSRPVVRRAIT